MEKLKKIIEHNKMSRLCRTFKTTKKFYFYDVGTGKIFEIDENLFKVCNELIKTNNCDSLMDLNLTKEELDKSINLLIECYEKENILRAPEVKTFTGPQLCNLRDSLKCEREQIILELTEVCNLRCKYCYYNDGQGGYREFGKQSMTFEIAKMAIDDLVENSGDRLVSISFYGGEPLLEFELFEKCIDYCETIKEKKFRFAMTTNGTLIDERVAKRISEVDDMHVTVSLDGPKEMNDKYRVFRNGEGAFDKTLKGLKLLVEAFGDRAGSSIGINVVLPEHTDEDLFRIQTFFDELEWLPKEVVYTSSFVSSSDYEKEYEGIDSDLESEVRERSMSQKRYFDPLVEWATENEKNSEGDDFRLNGIAKDNIVKDLALIHKRRLSAKPMEDYAMNGCCTPGARRIYVTTKGDYLLCEKMGAAPSIGNCRTGVDIDKIKKHYIDDFNAEATKYCNNCWAVHLCSMCYMNCYKKEGLNIKYRHGHCVTNRIYVEKTLSLYHELLEHKPKFVDSLNRYELS